MATFFHLPRELRDMIYRLYVVSDGGYVLNPESNRLRNAMGRPIDLALTYTCKRVADEMRGLALEANTITVSTFYSPHERHRARDFDVVMTMLHDSLQSALNRAELFLWDDICAEISGTFPQFTPVLDMIKHDTWHSTQGRSSKQGPWGEPPSVYRDFVRFALQTISDLDYRHRFNDEFAKAFCNTDDIRPLLDLDPAPWMIPTQYDLRQMVDMLGGKSSLRSFGFVRGWMGSESATRRAMYRYSAAAVGIRFLKSNTLATRAHLRDIVLIEDQESVSNPACHAMGLIPFCQENPAMRIERRVSLWHNAFFYHSSMSGATGWRTKEYRQVEANEMSFAVARWVIETLPLIPAGMPANSFTLVLDGEGDPQCTEIFQTVVLRDAAWQQAMDECFQSGDLPPEPYGMRRNSQRNYVGAIFPAFNESYLFDKFPQAMQEIVEGTSMVRCTFDPGEIVDVQRLKSIAKRESWSLDHWRVKWYDREKKTYETTPPLPSWSAIKAGYLSNRHVGPFRR
ncbi:uncharacterized protein BDZ83DRAFT_635122 [Colletotrichum acutatum]|uniref:Uncharacterized protein n=1 Tax=Glomerella acutata TaxID=27357 RepID=A0AAD8UF02_GLOAC|nr:uncharacterized protein BDZ83DRAFT_635122 [Colletotrichum acutatum]KAK1716100.1 hypothetical protein BDZ83DRAFT_635122 [Colletotrichum acutatum]